jgi:hypothetical protein
LPPNEQPGVDAAVVQDPDDGVARHRPAGPGREREAEPRRLGPLGGLGQHERLLEVGQALAQAAPVRPPRGDEASSLVELGDADRGLHVGHFRL